MAADLKTQVLEASVQLIAEQGLSGLSMREVARRAGVSHQAPYHYFADKESIVAALVERGFTLLADRLEVAAKTKGTITQRLAKTGREYVDFALDQPVYFRLMFRPELAQLGRFPEAVAAGGRAFAVLQALIEEKCAGQRVPPAKRDAMVSMHWGLVHGVSSLLVDGVLGQRFVSPQERDRHVTQVLELFTQAAG
ncbi:MAG: TetR/AcrR family transcriptional regulator [Archangiaceae bacterium]|nr:TetR/AcrR family transcriptional regulator [Archangiaceae bacterium]